MNQRIIVPPIKCQGIKTKLVDWIRDIIPKDFSGQWIEPFMGSSVVAFNIDPQQAILADSNPHLINFYQAINDGEITSTIARVFLEREGKLLEQSNGEYYYVIRERFNEQGNPLDFLFLNRACFNGMIRFNRQGKFNVPFCRKPQRFAPAYITKICNQINAIEAILSIRNYQFIRQDFSNTINLAKDGDLIYCDPPYIDRHTNYYNSWNHDHEKALKKSLELTKARFILSTWHSNDYRKNEFISTVWSEYKCLTRQHFYHVGAKEKNRNPILEAVITNFDFDCQEIQKTQLQQLNLFEM